MEFFCGPVIEIRMKEPTDFTTFAEANDLRTVDDVVNELVKGQQLTPEQAQGSPKRTGVCPAIPDVTQRT